MATPFDHLDSFQKLDPETKAKVMDRFNTLGEEDKQKVMSKINTPMSVRDSDPGLQDVSITPLTQGEFQKTGEDVSAHMMTKGMINSNIDPYLAATVGTAIAMIPHVAASMIGPSGAKAASKAVDAVGESGVVQAIKGTGSKQVMALNEKMAELPIKQAAKKELANTTLQAAKTGIGEAEANAGVGANQLDVNSEFQRIISSKEKLSAFANRASKLADMGADKLSQMSSETLQTFRKLSQEGLKASGSLNDLSRNQLYKAKQVFTNALAQREPEIGDAMSRYNDIQKVINSLPASAKAQKQTLQLALVKAKNLAQQQATTRKLIGGGLTAAAAGGYVYNKAKQAAE